MSEGYCDHGFIIGICRDCQCDRSELEQVKAGRDALSAALEKVHDLVLASIPGAIAHMDVLQAQNKRLRDALRNIAEVETGVNAEGCLCASCLIKEEIALAEIEGQK